MNFGKMLYSIIKYSSFPIKNKDMSKQNVMMLYSTDPKFPTLVYKFDGIFYNFIKIVLFIFILCLLSIFKKKSDPLVYNR